MDGKEAYISTLAFRVRVIRFMDNAELNNVQKEQLVEEYLGNEYSILRRKVEEMIKKDMEEEALDGDAIEIDITGMLE